MPFWYKPLMCWSPSTKKWVRIPILEGWIVEADKDKGTEAEKKIYDKFYRGSGVRKYFRLCYLGARGPHGTKEEARKSFLAELAGKTRKPKNEKTKELKNG